VAAAEGTLHLVCAKSGAQAMKTSWALLAVCFAHGKSIQATDSQTDKGPQRKEVAKEHSSKAVPTCTQ